MSGHDVSLMPGYQSKEIRNEMALLSLPSFSLWFERGTDKKWSPEFLEIRCNSMNIKD